MPQMAGSLVRYPARVTTLWFVSMIAMGSFFLAMPWSHRSSAHPISWLDACFTATSALCVTGLSVRSTPHDFSFVGQLVILALIQLGGIGIMTLTTFILMQLGGRSGLRHRAVIAETLGAGEHSDVRLILRRVLGCTAIIEGAGIAILWLRFLFDGRSVLGALWQAIFHAISAFCNAGFALYDDSLIRYQSDPIVNLVVCALIILGGLGFPVLLDVYNGFRWSKPFDWYDLHIHSKVTLIGTGVLLLGGFVLFLVIEWDNAIAGQPWYAKVMIAAFHSTTCRTAGFNSIDLNDLTNASLFITILLMAIGAGPCSTAGGIKVSTVSLLAMQAYRRFQGRSCLSFFRRTIPQAAVDRAMATVMTFFAIGTLACTLLMVVEQSGRSHRSLAGQSDSALDLVFEVISALGTVGLSTGVTPNLSALGKCVIIGLMFLGRLGPISVISALSKTTREAKVEFANEEPLVG
jgi:trk system potassium uptake protein TrkH